jgi:hypothetical protein|tara:strand:+ start:2203 stop:2436 length:234 start_codon:yes stop_codon:yes gene_type:complete
MNYSNRKWVIVNVSDITDEMILSSIQYSKNTLRKSLDGTKAILKWNGDTPSCFDGMTTYNYSEILTELSSSEWSSDE